MRWKKLGLIFAPTGDVEWMASHASNPVAMQIDGLRYRIFFSARDKENRSCITYLDLTLNVPTKPIEVSSYPLLTAGVPGAFDDSGVSMGAIYTSAGSTYIYYLGWNLGVTVPFRNSIGLALYDSKKNLMERHSEAPILDRSQEDPFSISYPFIQQENGHLRMWYGSHLCWGSKVDDMRHVIKYAESDNGINWTRKNQIVIPLHNDDEIAVSRPTIIKHLKSYHMLYSYRSKSQHYRIGYATSDDGMHWCRVDDCAGIDVSASGWDSEMVCYPSFIKHDNDIYLLYCGNSYGKSGFGIAKLETW
jgi:hypothetical protein